jgi:hypothetical protein
MLTNAFSYLPMKNEANEWSLLSDLQLAKFLRGTSHKERMRRLASPLGDAPEISLLPAKCMRESTLMADALEAFDGTPLLIVRGQSRRIGGNFDRL